jgi:hypothetical protein
MRKFLGTTGLVALLVFALVASACSKDSNTATDATSASPAAASPTESTADAYASAVCGALDTWLTDIQSASSSLTAGITDPSQAKDQLVTFLDGLAQSTEQMVTTVKEAGVPAVEAGQEAAAAIQDSLSNVKTVFEDARDQIANLSTSNPKEFAQALKDIGSSMQAAASQATSSLDGITDPDLNEAFASNPTCTSMGMGLATSSPTA